MGKKIFLSVSELFSEYALHFLRTVFIVSINLIVARILLGSEFFGDFRVAVKFLILLAAVLNMLYPFVEKLVKDLSESNRRLIYFAVYVGMSGILNGGYILSRNITQGSSFLDYLNYHPIHILLLGLIIFSIIQLIAARLSAQFTNHIHDASYALFGILLLFASLFLSELNLNTIVMLFFFSQCLLLGVAWSMYRFGGRKILKSRHVNPKVNLMQQTSLAVSLFALELLSTEQSVAHFAIIISISSLIFVVTQPLAKSLESLDEWSKSYLPKFGQLFWINAFFALAMFLILMPLSRYLIAWISSGIVLDLGVVDQPYLETLRVALLGYLVIACVRPFFSILMRFNEKLANQVKYFKLGILSGMLLVLVPPYGLYGAVVSELVAAFSIYSFVIFYLVEHDAIDLKDLKKISP